MSLDFTVKEFILGGGTGTPTFQFYRRGFNLGGSGGSEPTWKDIILKGNTALTLVNSKADGLNYLTLFGGCEQRNLPYGYTQYDNLIGDGSAYINLDCPMTQDDELVIEFTKTNGGTSKDLGGYRASASSNNISAIIASNGNVVADFNNSDYTNYRLNQAVSLNVRYKVVINKTGRYIYQGDTLLGSNTTACPDTISCLSCYLFNLGGSGFGNGFIGIIHRAIIKGKRDVVPCYNGTEYGMYDRLNGVFYPNANTEGSFTVGNAVVPTPDYPVDVVCNNGAIKFSPNMANYIEDNVTLGYWIRNTDGTPELSSANFYTNYMPVKPNLSYIAYGRSKSNDVISGYNRIAWYDIDKNWISNTTYTANTIGKGIAPANAYFARFHCNINGSTVTQELVDSYNWVFQEGTSEVPYQPYVEGGIYTDGTVETVEVFGNNLIDLSAVTDGYYYTPQGTYTSLSASRLTDYIPIEEGKDVKVYFKSLSTLTNLNVRINLFNSSKVWQSQEVLQLLPLADSTMIITPTYNGYIRVSGNYSGTAIVEWNTASITESLGSATAEMLLKVGDYQDIQSVLDGEVTRKVGVKVLDGTEDWKMGQTFYIDNDFEFMRSAYNTPYCTHYKGISGDSIATDYINSNSIRLYNTSTLYRLNIFAVMSDYADVNVFKQFLANQYNSGNPVVVVYPLATATTETVTAQPLTIQAGTNIVEITQASMDNLGLEVSYKGKEGE